MNKRLKHPTYFAPPGKSRAVPENRPSRNKIRSMTMSQHNSTITSTRDNSSRLHLSLLSAAHPKPHPLPETNHNCYISLLVCGTLKPHPLPGTNLNCYISLLVCGTLKPHPLPETNLNCYISLLVCGKEHYGGKPCRSGGDTSGQVQLPYAHIYNTSNPLKCQQQLLATC